MIAIIRMFDFSIIKLQECKETFVKTFVITYTKRPSSFNLKLINVLLKYYNEIVYIMCDYSNFTIITSYYFLLSYVWALLYRIMKIYFINQILPDYMRVTIKILEFFHSFLNVSIEKN